jgi:type IV pilus assembly protein PilB
MPAVKTADYSPDASVVDSIPRRVRERFRAWPLSLENGDLLVAIADPLDVEVQDKIKEACLSCNVRFAVADRDDIEAAIAGRVDANEHAPPLPPADKSEFYGIQSSLKSAMNIGEREEPDSDAPTIRLVNGIIKQAVDEGASDVHVEPCESSLRVRYRVDGVLSVAHDFPSSIHPSVTARLKIMANMDIAEKRKPQDGRILTEIDGRSVDLRASSLPTMAGEKIALRVMGMSAVGLDKLGMEPDDMKKVDAFSQMPSGMLLATGPTGSGKSTTLYAILKKMNRPGVNIITIEDPVEYAVPGINQVQVNERAGVTFGAVLRSILRQDPDKIMIGEMRDSETAQLAVRAALTGHLVLSTLHTNDAPSSVTRIVDMGVEPFLVAATLNGVIAQRLVRRLCHRCREEYALPDEVCEAMGVPSGSRAWRPAGCAECRGGYSGRMGIYEIMTMDSDLKKMVTERADSADLLRAARAKGMKTLRASGADAVLAGHTSVDEVFRAL